MNFNVTFYNVLARRRGTLVTDVTEEQADAIVKKYSDPKEVFFYLPEVKKEPVDVVL